MDCARTSWSTFQFCVVNVSVRVPTFWAPSRSVSSELPLVAVTVTSPDGWVFRRTR